MPTIKYLDYDGLDYFWDKINNKKQDKLTAGSNITISGNTISATDTTYSNATTSTAGLMSAADKTKLNGIATGAEVNVQSDWNVTDTASDAFIKNKPSIPTKTSDLTNDSGFITSAAVPTDYVTIDTAQDVTGAKTFKAVTNIQNGQGTGSLWIGGNVNASGATNNTRHLARIVVPSYANASLGATMLGFDTSGDSDMHVANKGSDVVSFGGMKKITNATSPMAIGFCVTDTRGATAAANKVYPLEMDATSARFNVRPNYNGTNLALTTDIPTVNNGTLTIQKNGTDVTTFTANQSSNATANITVPTTVLELSDSANYATTSALASKQDILIAGDHIDITSNTISAVDYVHSDDPVSTTAVTPVVTNNMIADGTITADKLATGATLKLTLSTSDIGEGAALAANTLYGVYQ